MIVEIASISVHIHDTLLNDSSREQLKNFISLPETGVSEFNLLPLDPLPPVSILKREKRVGNNYYEDEHAIFK
jgi:hypothetical protein